jgi:AraC-like DNA-binding protein
MDEFSEDAGFWVVQVEPPLATRALARSDDADGPFDGWLQHLAYGLAGHVVAEPDGETFARILELARRGTVLVEPELSTLLATLLRGAFAASVTNLVQVKGLGLAFSVPAAIAAGPTLDRSQVARRVGISDAYLTRLLQRDLGVTFEGQRNTMRLLLFVAAVDEARDRKRDFALLDAAMTAGFGSYSQLHRVFVSTVGSRPSDYLFGKDRERLASRVSPSATGESRRGKVTAVSFVALGVRRGTRLLTGHERLMVLYEWWSGKTLDNVTIFDTSDGDHPIESSLLVNWWGFPLESVLGGVRTSA